MYRILREDLEKYLPAGGSASCGAKNGQELAQALLGKKVKAVDCSSIDKRLAEVIDAVLSIDIRLPESDPMMQKVPEKLFEYNSPDSDSPILVTSNSVITHQVLKLIFDTTKVKAFVVPVDTMGYTLDNSVVTNNFTSAGVMRALQESGISAKNPSRKMIISGLAKEQKGSIERITRWSVEIGPVSGFELPLYLTAGR